MGTNKCHNKPLHHEGFISHINFAPHIPSLPARSESLPNTLALLPRRSFCLPTTTFPPHPTSFDPPNHRTSSKPPRTMPAKKKTTPAKLRKRQASNADEQPVKRTRRGQNDDNDDDQEDPNQWADYEEQATETKGRAGKGGKRGRARAPAQRCVHPQLMAIVVDDCHRSGAISTPIRSPLTISTGKSPRTAIERTRRSSRHPGPSKPRAYPLPLPLSFVISFFHFILILCVF